MTYTILKVIAIVLIVVGVALAALSAYTFKKRNLAEAYDAIYDRGYVERAEKRKKAKADKKKQSIESDIKKAESQAAEIQKPQVNANANVNINRVTPSANSGATTVLTPSANSGATTVLTPSANSGATTVLTPTPNSGETTVLTPNQAPQNVPATGQAQKQAAPSTNFVIYKDLYYASSTETVK